MEKSRDFLGEMYEYLENRGISVDVKVSIKDAQLWAGIIPLDMETIKSLQALELIHKLTKSIYVLGNT
jgi:hypothetical protein